MSMGLVSNARRGFGAGAIVCGVILTACTPASAEGGREASGRTERRSTPAAATADAARPPVESEFEKVLVPRSLEGPIDAATYILGPSDELLLVLRGPTPRLEYLLILPEGNVILPNVGSMRASGLTLAEFRTRVKKALGRFYRNIEIDCQLSRPRTFVVFVLGEVKSPSPVELMAPFRVSRALEGAAGVKETGSVRRIEIREQGRTVRTVDLFAFNHLGKFDENPMLREGQSVFVPPRGDEVTVIGEVRLPGRYEVVGGETAADVIRICGGITTRGDDKNILLERITDGKVEPSVSFSLDDAPMMKMQDLDVIVVRDRMSFGGVDPVIVFGGGGRTGRFNVDKAEPLREFLQRLWRFMPEYDIETAVIERNTHGAEPVYIPFNAKAVLAGGNPAGETTVQPGDIINFPRLPNQIFVTGEVREPGGIPFQPGIPAERYIARAGGATDAGSYNKLSIFSLSGAERKGDRSSVVYRGETIVVKRKRSKFFGSLFVGLTTVTGVVLSVIAISSK